MGTLQGPGALPNTGWNVLHTWTVHVTKRAPPVLSGHLMR